MSEILTGILSVVKWRSPDEDKDFTIATLRTGETVKGNASANSLIVGLTYTFQGDWKDDKEFRGQKQKSFYFTKLQAAEPHSRQGVIQYLQKFAPGIGPTLSGRLWDAFGDRAVLILRTRPEEAAEVVKGLSVDVANAAANELQANAKFEEVRIDLAELFAGRGFGNQLVSLVIKKWGVKAAAVIRRDPFCLLVAEFPGCGFARCDRLYLELQRKPYRLKRLMLCIWNQLRSDMEGHTWHDGRKIIDSLKQQATISDIDSAIAKSDVSPEARIRRALQLGVRAGWLALHRDPEGRIWIAEGQAARNERSIAEDIQRIILASQSDWLDGEENLERQESLQLLAYQRTVAECGSVAPDEDDSTYLEKIDHSTSISEKVQTGRKTGICQFCGRQLLKEESKVRGYGPICAERNGLPWGDEREEQEERDEVSVSFYQP